MELRQLQYALMIAAERNFSRAAEKLHIAQPSLSQQLSKLEKELGVLLFQRNTSTVELTHAGMEFMKRAQRIVDEMEILRVEMEDISQLRKGRITVGSMPITGSHLLPHVLPAFRTDYPGIDVTLLEDTSHNLERLTASGKSDISLLSLPLNEPTLDYEPIADEPIDLAVPPGHRLALRSGSYPLAGVSMRELEHEPFIILKQGQGFRKIVLDLCREAGYEPHVVFESSNMETLQSLVAAGMGVTLVPRFVARAKRSELLPVYLPLADPVPSRTLVIAYRRGRSLSKAAEAFTDTLRRTMEQRLSLP
ncbi:LysR family transcriptional regulator [Saccharibacillus sp. CPCC 101409]|uniref:LysR family transcriptional regulator n=1 Tax=Saccharibacillus sp. CPCC 101409 TaxID=3058041 RepID=UPI0026741E50|nr:LysR family transcriptional regulator [Saccharibacillus sp. CPCC 101409]MDO3409664.1 LysR family transcriptional regulator [Saccharibacillus sp. CPCC 101409]